MTHTEFSNEFDVLYNNIMSNQSPGLNEYEKSVFLTKAQNELIKNHFNPGGNKYKEGMDDSPKRQIDFSELITVASPSEQSPTIGNIDNRGKIYYLPTNLLLILNETASSSTVTYQVIPISYTEYSRLMSKPYKEPLKWQVWRLIGDSATASSVSVEIIPNTSSVITNYKVRYVRRPLPIVLEALTGSLTIDGVSAVSECELNPILHKEILDRAIELAKAAYTGDVKSIVELNSRNE